MELELKGWLLEEDIKLSPGITGKATIRVIGLDDPIKTVEVYKRGTINSILGLLKLHVSWFEMTSKRKLTPWKLEIDKNNIKLTLI